MVKLFTEGVIVSFSCLNNIIDYFGNHTGASALTNILLTGSLVLITAYYAYQSKKQADEAQKLRLDSFDKERLSVIPFIQVDYYQELSRAQKAANNRQQNKDWNFTFTKSDSTNITSSTYFVLKNVGIGPAIDINITKIGRLVPSPDTENQVGLSLRPSESQIIELYSDIANVGAVMMTITFKNVLSDRYTQRIDLQFFIDQQSKTVNNVDILEIFAVLAKQ